MRGEGGEREEGARGKGKQNRNREGGWNCGVTVAAPTQRAWMVSSHMPVVTQQTGGRVGPVECVAFLG